MSDAQPGPGWWLASDGKWYPPELRPQPLPPPPVAAPYGGAGPYPWAPGVSVAPVAPVVSGRSVSSGLTGTVQGFAWAAGALSAIAAVLALVSLGAFSTYWHTPINSRAEARAYETWRDVDDAFAGVAGLSVLCAFVLWILLVVWMYSAHKATQQLWPGRRRWSSGWTVGGWFIPLANAVIPKLVLNEIERIALAPRRDGRVDATYTQRPLLVVGTLWWIGVIAGTVLNALGNGLGSEVDASRGEIRAGYVCNAAGLVLLAASGVLGALYVRRIGRRLSRDAMTDPT